MNYEILKDNGEDQQVISIVNKVRKDLKNKIKITTEQLHDTEVGLKAFGDKQIQTL